MFFESDVVIIEGENVLISLHPEWLHVFQSLHLIIRQPALRQISVKDCKYSPQILQHSPELTHLASLSTAASATLMPDKVKFSKLFSFE